MDWHSRHNCKTQQEAIEALASLPELEYENILGGHNMYSIFGLKGKASEFAAMWKIPFDPDGIYKAAQAHVKKLKSQEGADEYEDSDGEFGDFGGWNGSTAICY